MEVVAEGVETRNRVNCYNLWVAGYCKAFITSGRCLTAGWGDGSAKIRRNWVHIAHLAKQQKAQNLIQGSALLRMERRNLSSSVPED
ncbi:hypothetical protein D3C75_630330 [compost metagenome]